MASMVEESSGWTRQRSEPRVAVEWRVGVVGIDQRGVIFNEEAQTVNVSRSGLCLTLNSEVPPGARISVSGKTNSVNIRVITFEVRWSKKPDGRLHTLGARLVSNDEWLALLKEINFNLE